MGTTTTPGRDHPTAHRRRLFTLAVIHALLGFTSEARFIRHAHTHLRPWFPYLPGWALSAVGMLFLVQGL